MQMWVIQVYKDEFDIVTPAKARNLTLLCSCYVAADLMANCWHSYPANVSIGQVKSRPAVSSKFCANWFITTECILFSAPIITSQLHSSMAKCLYTSKREISARVQAYSLESRFYF